MGLSVTSRNWFFRWAYLFTTQKTRDAISVTTLCDMFWRSVLLTPFQILVLAAAVTLVSLVVIEAGLWDTLEVIGIIVAAVAGILGVGFVGVFTEESIKGSRRNAITTAVELTRAGVSSVKERYCPIVRVEQRW